MSAWRFAGLVQSRVARIGGGLTGRLWATAEEGNLWEITVHQFGFAANFGSGRFQPGLHLRVPLDDDWEWTPMKYVYGINFTVKLGASD